MIKRFRTVVWSNEAPEDINVLWLDTSNAPVYQLKFKNPGDDNWNVLYEGGAFFRGNDSESKGEYSIATGDHAVTKTGARGALSAGVYTEASNEGELAVGKYNKSNGNTISSVGIGSSSTGRKNAIEVLDNGGVYVYGIGNYDGVLDVANGDESLQEVIAGENGILDTLSLVTQEIHNEQSERQDSDEAIIDELHDSVDALRSYTDSAIAGVTQFDYKIVSVLPQSGIKGTIYLVNEASSPNAYKEYIWIEDDEEWELISPNINLDGYASLNSENTFTRTNTFGDIHVGNILLGEGKKITFEKEGTFDVEPYLVTGHDILENGLFAKCEFRAFSFVKHGGTSSEFLKADGSVDSNNYVISPNLQSTTISAWALAQQKPSYNLDEITDGVTKKWSDKQDSLANTTILTINNTPLGLGDSITIQGGGGGGSSYPSGTKAQIDTGTDTTDRVWSASVLASKFNTKQNTMTAGVDYQTPLVAGTDYQAPLSVGTTSDIAGTTPTTIGKIWGGDVLRSVFDTKQEKLVSGTNIKTINGQSVLGSGNISISGGGTGGDVNVIEVVKRNGTAITVDSTDKSVNVIVPTDTSDLTNSAGFATTTDVSNALSGYATEQWVTNKNYLTQHQDISGKADITDVPTKVSDLNNDLGFTANVGTITGVSLNGAAPVTSGTVQLTDIQKQTLSSAITINGQSYTTVEGALNAIATLIGTINSVLENL